MLKRFFLTLFIILLIVLALAHFWGLSYAVDWFNENSKDLIGRKAQVESTSINYLTAGVSVDGFVLFEADDKTPFVLFDELYVNLDLQSIIEGETYKVEGVTLDGLNANIIYDAGSFNFQSLIEHFIKEEVDTGALVEKEPVKWIVEAIEIENSTIAYHDLKIGEDVAAENIYLQLPNGIAWDTLGVAGAIDFELNTGGSIASNFDFANDYSAFKADLKLDSVSNKFLLPYVQDFLLVSDMEGEIGIDIQLVGSLTEAGNIDLTGDFSLENTALYNLGGERLFGIGSLAIAVDSLNAARNVYAARSVKIDEPYGWFQLFENGNNLSALLKDSLIATATDSSLEVSDSLFVKNDSIPIVVSETDHSSNFFVLIGDYVKQAMKDIQVSDFNLDTLSIERLSFDFEDYTLKSPFKYSTRMASLHSNGISNGADSVMVYSEALLGDSGSLTMKAKLDPTLHEDFVVNITLSDIGLTPFSPYLYQHLAHHLQRGELDFKGDVEYHSGELNSLFHIRIDSMQVSKREMHDEATKLPLRLAVKVLNGKSDIIDLEIPVEGNLKDPKYKLGKAIGKIFKNLITKSANAKPDAVASDSVNVILPDTLVVPVDSIIPVVN